MARKRKALQKVDYQSKEYWNRLLAEEGLSMERGKHPRRLVYVGDEQELLRLEFYENLDGRKLSHNKSE